MRTAMTMRASVLCDVARLEVRDVPRPVPGARDLLVRISAVGLCGTDLHIFAGHANYHTDGISRVIPLTEQTQILGHEITGLVEEVGKDVHDLEAGVRVVIDQGLNCMSAGRLEQCEYCLSGDSHQCEFYGEHGITGLPGGLAEYICVPAVNAVRINSDIEAAEAAMTEPLGCILHSSAMVEAARTRYRLNATNPSAECARY
jgi:L-iditol 2-dehydrogenase